MQLYLFVLKEGTKMIKRIMFVLFVFCFIYSFTIEAQEVPSGRRLRDIVADRYGDSIIIGGTTAVWLLGTNTGEILDREFSYVTPENDFKQFSIHPDNSSWNWWAADQWVTHIDENEQILRMHCPIGPQCSSWAMDDSRTAVELDTNMAQFLREVCKRYNGTTGFEYMDVVNETVIDGNWHTQNGGVPDQWECPWYKIGLDDHGVPIYIVKAFEIANEYAPDIKLIYNHHEDPQNFSSWNLIKQTVFYLRDTLGLRVDGIGWQSHVDKGWESEANLDALRNLIDWAHSNNLEFHVTEASVWITDGATQEHFEEQAVTYRAILDVLLGKRFTGKVGWNTWHIDDSHGWHTEWYPSLFSGSSSYAAKPAYYAIQAALENGGGVEEQEENASGLKLYNTPNPFSSKTSIWFEIPEKSYVSLKIYNLSGQEILTIVSGDMEAGRHKIEWNAAELPSGVYFCRMVAGDFIGRQEMLLVR
jgi:endo-1,4-beta-xylanase